jgi:cation diffusion facilitator CzcD-associated flavoprotein CzcO
VDFSNKRVAVIGNGSSAVQLIVSTILRQKLI